MAQRDNEGDRRAREHNGHALRLLPVAIVVGTSLLLAAGYDARSVSGLAMLAGIAFGIVVALGVARILRVGQARQATRRQDASAGATAQQASSPAQMPVPAEKPGAQGASTALAASAPRTSTLDFPAFSEVLLASSDPISELKHFVGDVRTREARLAEQDLVAGSAPAEQHEEVLAPSDAERTFARLLEEAGLFSSDVALPRLHVVMPHRSGMLYLRMEDESTTYLATLRMLSIEAALNRMRFVCRFFGEEDVARAHEGQILEFLQNLEMSVAAQAADASTPARMQSGQVASGEWAAREGLSIGIESFQLPYRLQASFRSNVAGGAMAIEMQVTPPEVFPRSCFSTELGRIIPTTAEMRSRAATSYALRVGLLLAAQAFHCAPAVSHVFVAGILDTASTHECLFSVDFDRQTFEQLELTATEDPARLYARFGATLTPGETGGLTPVEQTFRLEDERFCPASRYEDIASSTRVLETSQGKALGAHTVADLGISEDACREHVANDIMRGLTHSTEQNVRMILDLTRDSSDPSVRDAARRTVTQLIDGSLSDENPLELGEAFVAGDDLSRAVSRGVDLVRTNRPGDAAALLDQALSPVDAAHAYDDNDARVFRYFSNYVERALFNRLVSQPGEHVALVPDSYFEAHLLLATALADQGSLASSMAHAARAYELDPLDDRAQLRIVRGLEAAGDIDLARDQLHVLLSRAHTPEMCGVAYYRMAFMQWKLGNITAAQACYRKSLDFASSSRPLALVELQTLIASERGGVAEEMDGARVNEILTSCDIPVAPTREVMRALYEGLRASTDAEVFPVARTFAATVAALSGDDVAYDVLRSMELEPDR